MWNRDPGWFDALPHAQQVRVLAEADMGPDTVSKPVPAPAAVAPRRVGKYV
jgi:hypothetical protein